MKSLTSKIVATVAFMSIGLAIPVALHRQMQVEMDAATADIDAIINKEKARQKRAEEAAKILNSYQ